VSPVTTLEHEEGRVFVEELGSGRKRLAVELVDRSAFMPEPTAETDYPLELIRAILKLRGPAMLGYSILRAEDPSHLAEPLRHYLLAYIREEEFRGKRLLDFGCGSGSSTVALASLFPETEIVACDLEQENVDVARLRAAHYGSGNVSFLVSPGPFEVPAGIGSFDFICLSAVYEHLLPAERPVLMGLLWRTLKPGGVLFVNQTPHRFYPLEYHTTGLPLLNYLPDRIAFWAARRLSRRVSVGMGWEELLRGGVRGGTERGILADLRASDDDDPVSLESRGLGFRDQVDLWYSLSMARRPLRAKRLMRVAFKAVSRLTGSAFVPDLNLAIRKPRRR
jgi:SAM-dependent methyltransferase